MAFEAVVRKWGNSVGIVFPKEYVKSRNLKVNQKIVVEVTKEADLSRVFGTLKSKQSAQKLKDIAREGWN